MGHLNAKPGLESVEYLVSKMTKFDYIEQILSRHRPEYLDLPTYTRAVVAVVLRSEKDGLEMLFIERASSANDPWSGDVGFPGGKVEEGDSDLRLTAERETREEIGLDLRVARYLGRLSDISGAHLPMLVSCFVYGVEDERSFVFNREIVDAFWISLGALASAESHIMARVRFDGKIFERPAIRLPQSVKPVLWGITFRFVTEFLELLRE
jgi:8-oxo-dGTP pyrophosphatase MutT (NUDIX family)